MRRFASRGYVPLHVKPENLRAAVAAIRALKLVDSQRRTRNASFRRSTRQATIAKLPAWCRMTGEYAGEWVVRSTSGRDVSRAFLV